MLAKRGNDGRQFDVEELAGTAAVVNVELAGVAAANAQDFSVAKHDRRMRRQRRVARKAGLNNRGWSVGLW